MLPLSQIIQENQSRLKDLYSPYCPISGEGSPVERIKVSVKIHGTTLSMNIPIEMASDPVVDYMIKKEDVSEDFPPEQTNEVIEGLLSLRMEYDFEFWAFSNVSIQDKETKQEIPFKLNKGQRKTLGRIEKMRLDNIPIRIVLLKARQWGGSTLIQVYFAWIQLKKKENWHSAIIADVENQARNIRGMYSRLARLYPKESGSITFKPYEGSTKNRLIIERGCIIGVGSVKNPDSLRSFDFALAHLSEVGLWKSTPHQGADDLAQAIRATVPTAPYTAIILESTAKGVGNFFHKEWQMAVRGESSYDPVFIPWWLIERYQREVPDYEKFINTWGEYELFLWGLGATLEGIYWYMNYKREEGYDDWRMKSEFPSNADEAFQSTGRRAFAPLYVLQARKTCRAPLFKGEIFGDSLKGAKALKDITVQQMDRGSLFIWSHPDTTVNISNRYCCFADIGGRSPGADYSVIKVFDRYWMIDGGVPEVVAVWHGHLDQDLFAWKCVQLAKYYNNALLAIEANSLNRDESEGDHFFTVLDEIATFYSNLYARTDPEKIRQGVPVKYGFHTNSKTKVMIIDALNAGLRDQSYIERDQRACDEMDYYEVKPNGSYGAVDGEHDDHVIVTGGGVWLCNSYMPLPKEIIRNTSSRGKSIVSEASI